MLTSFSLISSALLLRVSSSGVSVTDEKDHVRYMAAKSLGYFKKKELALSLIRMLSDENEYVRRISAVSLGNIGGRTAYMALVKAAESETEERAKAAMTDAIARIEPTL